MDVNQIWEDYTIGKQTYDQLAKEYNCSRRTIQRYIDNYKLDYISKSPRSVIILMDTTYFGRSFGVMVFKDAITGEILLTYFVKSETNLKYKEGIDYIKLLGFSILGIVCDGRKGLLNMFGEIPVQMCCFHQVAIIRRYLTKNPKMRASKDLWSIMLLLKDTDKESFIGLFNGWIEKWQSFIDEKFIDENGKKRYIHKRLRSAVRSIKTNLKYLFIWYDNYDLKIPNTTNSLDGQFSNLKNKLRCHNGLNKPRKQKFILDFFKA